MVVKFSIVISNWNGKGLLEKNLPAVLATGADEVIVSDDASTDGSQEYLKKIQKSKTPKLKVIFNKKNLGFAASSNLGVRAAKGEIVVLLNTDVLPQEGFLKPLEEDFQDPKVFAVSLAETQWSWAKGKWVSGFVEHEPGPRTKKPHISLWASGGSAAFRKSIWEKLGGFDEIFTPFYWEDIDLSYRAWKRGYKVLWEPKAVVHHHHQGTIKRFPKEYVRYISERNQLIFIWKNITSLKMMFQHKFWLGKRLLTNPGYWKPFLGALVKLPIILPRRFQERQAKKLFDEKIFAQFD
jgi:GT2 family glycosyltransferase